MGNRCTHLLVSLEKKKKILLPMLCEGERWFVRDNAVGGKKEKEKFFLICFFCMRSDNECFCRSQLCLRPHFVSLFKTIYYSWVPRSVHLAIMGDEYSHMKPDRTHQKRRRLVMLLFIAVMIALDAICYISELVSAKKKPRARRYAKIRMLFPSLPFPFPFLFPPLQNTNRYTSPQQTQQKNRRIKPRDFIRNVTCDALIFVKKGKLHQDFEEQRRYNRK